MPWVRCIECRRYWECAPGDEDEPCPKCADDEEDYDKDELGIDPEEEFE